MAKNARAAAPIALVMAWLLLLPLAATTGAQGRDPVTGRWGSDGLTYLDLKFDGKSTVTGTTIWRAGDRPEQRAAIKTGTFDLRTGALKLAGEGTRPDGVVASYVIEGRIDGETVTGTFVFGDRSGEFAFKKQ